MDSCRKIRSLIEHHLEQGSGDNCPEMIRNHLDQCPDCRGYWDHLQATEKTLREAASAPSISSTAHQRILEALSRESVPERSFPRNRLLSNLRIRWLAAAALLALVVGVFLMTKHFTGSSNIPGQDSTNMTRIRQYTSLSASPSALFDVLKPPGVTVAARQDLSWLESVMIADQPVMLTWTAPVPEPGGEPALELWDIFRVLKLFETPVAPPATAKP